MDAKTQNAIVAIGTAAVTAIAQHFAISAPVSHTREANREANFECRDQLATVITLLATCEADE